jgi:UDP-3-O-[3-hydroxymyristoyl] glucosamine N-acyltransferase
VGIVGHIKIADGVRIAAQSGVSKSIEQEGEVVQGSPSFKIGEYKRSYVLFRNLPKLNDTVNEILKKMNSM